MDYSGVYKEEGFYIPLDYGHIVGALWVAHEVLIIGLANGDRDACTHVASSAVHAYQAHHLHLRMHIPPHASHTIGYIVVVSAPLLMRQRKNASASAPGRDGDGGVPRAGSTKPMSTTRIFEGYLSALTTIDGAPAVLGDKSLKVLNIDMSKWGEEDCLSVAADIEIEGFTARPGVYLQQVWNTLLTRARARAYTHARAPPPYAADLLAGGEHVDTGRSGRRQVGDGPRGVHVDGRTAARILAPGRGCGGARRVTGRDQ